MSCRSHRGYEIPDEIGSFPPLFFPDTLAHLVTPDGSGTYYEKTEEIRSTILNTRYDIIKGVLMLGRRINRFALAAMLITPETVKALGPTETNIPGRIDSRGSFCVISLYTKAAYIVRDTRKPVPWTVKPPMII